MNAGGSVSGAAVDEKTIDDHLAVQAIIRSYQVKQLFTCFSLSFLFLRLHVLTKLRYSCAQFHIQRIEEK